MIFLREGTTFDAAAPGNVAWVADKSKDENLEAHKIYAQKPHNDTLSLSRNLASLRTTVDVKGLAPGPKSDFLEPRILGW